MPTRLRRRFTSVLISWTAIPSTTRVPLSIGSSRLIVRRSVLLPEPDGPMITSTSPSRTASVMPRSTCSAPKCLWTSRNSIIGCSIMAEMAAVTTFFSGHPVRIGGAAAAILVLAGLAWYLGSPLFVRTYTNEALPAPTTSGATTRATVVASATPAPASPRILSMGELGYVDSIHNGKGPVRIVEVGGQLFVRFEDVAITNAPDVHVYLSRETGGRWVETTSLYLGDLKATNGSFNYELPAGTVVVPFKSVAVWCRAFRVLLTRAQLA